MINTYMSQVARIVWGLIVLSVTVSPDFEIEEQQCGMLRWWFFMLWKDEKEEIRRIEYYCIQYL
jgi:hypothetical protein